MKKLSYFLVPLLTIVVAVFLAEHRLGQAQTWGYNGTMVSSNGAGVYIAGVWVPSVRSGSVGLTALETSHPVLFSSPLLDTNYVIHLSPSLLTTAFWSSKATDGFTLNLTIGITGRVDYTAICLPP